MIQAIINAQNSAALTTAIAVIQAYVGNADALTIAQLVAVTVTDATEVNLAQYKIQIALSDAVGLNSASKIQTIVISVNTAQTALVAAIKVISDYAANDNASALILAQLTAAGVNGIVGNIPQYITAIANATELEANTTAKIQIIINNVNAEVVLSNAINVIKGYINNHAGALTITELTAAKVVSLVEVNLGSYKTAINALLLTTDLDSTSKIQAVIDGVNAAEVAYNSAIAAIKAYAANDDASQLSIAQLTLTKVTSIVDANIAAYRLAIAAAPGNLADDTAKIQTIVTNTNTAEATKIITDTIKGYAVNDNASALTITALKIAGVTGTVDGYLEAYKTAIAGATEEQANSTTDLQGLIGGVNTTKLAEEAAAVLALETAAIHDINVFASNDDASLLVIAKLTAAGITGTIDANLAAYKVAIEESTQALSDTKSEIQTIINATNVAEAVIAVDAIKAYATADDAGALTIAQLTVAGVTTATVANLAAYRTAIAALNAVDVDTLAKINVVVNAKNLLIASIAAIRDYAVNDNAGALTIQQLGDAGVSTNPANLDAYKVAIAAVAGTDSDTTAKIQGIINNTNAAQIIVAAINVIKGYADDATGLTSDQLTLAGVTGVVENNVVAYGIAIVAKVATDLDSTSKIQAIVESVNAAAIVAAQTAAANALAAAVLVISNYASNDDATALMPAQLTAAGVTGIVDNNLDAYKVAIALATLAQADTKVEIQSIIDGVNIAAAILVIQAYATADIANSLTIAELIASGVTNTVVANLAAYKTAIAAATATEVDTATKIQAIVTGINSVSGNATISNVTVGSVEGTIPAGSSDSVFYPTVVVSIDATVTSISKSNFLLADSATIELYTSNDFATGLVPSTGISITTNATILYAKVVSANGLNTKYYKIVLNVIDAAKKYVIAITPFTVVGSNFVSTVTIDRGQASTLADAKLLLIYTLADGETHVYITQNVVDGSNKIVVGALGISRVVVALVNGDVDWTLGVVYKSNLVASLVQ